MSEIPDGTGQQLDRVPVPGPSRPPLTPRKVRTIRNMVLIGCVVVVVVVLFAVVVGKLVDKPSSPASFGAVNLTAVPAGPDFAPMNKGGAVPADVLNALDVPAGSTVVSRLNETSQSESPFDGTVTYTSPDGLAEIAKFFPAELAQEGWRVERSTDPILAMIAGSDTYYWEVGVTMSKLTSSSGHSDGTKFKVELYTYVDGD